MLSKSSFWTIDLQVLRKISVGETQAGLKIFVILMEILARAIDVPFSQYSGGQLATTEKQMCAKLLTTRKIKAIGGKSYGTRGQSPQKHFLVDKKF